MASKKSEKSLYFAIMTLITISSAFNCVENVSATSDDWPMFRHDPIHSGRSHYSTTPNSASVLWTFSSGYEHWSSPAVANGKVVIGAYSDTHAIFALNEETGSKLWEKSADSIISYSTAAISDGRVFIPCYTGRLYALDENTGGFLWSFKPSSGTTTSSPTVANGKVILGYQDGGIYSLSEVDGSQLWSRTLGVIDHSSAAIVLGKVFIGCTDGTVFSLRESDGVTVWSYPTGGEIHSSPACFNGRVFIGSSSNLYAIYESDGSLAWSRNMGAFVFGSPAVANGRVYIGLQNGDIVALDQPSGSEVWRVNLGGAYINSSPSISADGKLFIGAGSRLYCLNENTGSQIWSYDTGGSVYGSPAIANDKVIIGSIGGEKVIAFASNEPELNISPTSWNFGTIEQGQTPSKTFTVSNAGGGTLTWQVNSYPNWLSINPTSGTDSGSFTATVKSTTSSGNYNDEIEVVSNDGTILIPMEVSVNPGTAHVQVSPTYGSPGSVITVYGNDFTPGASVNIRLGVTNVGSPTIQSDGTFETTFTVPAVSFDKYTLEATTSYEVATCTFKVGIVAIIISPTSGLVGTEVTLTGVGFEPGTYDCYFGGTKVIDNGIISSSETLSGTFFVPNVVLGTYSIIVSDEIGTELETTFTVTRIEDDDDTITGAILLSINVPYEAEIDPAGDFDYYKFPATSGVTYTLETSGSTDTYMYLYSTDGTSLIESDNDDGDDNNAKIIWGCTSSGTYYFKIRHYNDPVGTGPYILTASWSGDSDESPSGANQLSLDDQYEAEISPAGDVDYYKFSATSGVTYTMETSGSTNTYMYLFSTDGTTVIEADDDDGEDYNAQIEWACTRTGTYYVKVMHDSGAGTGLYELTISKLMKDLTLISEFSEVWNDGSYHRGLEIPFSVYPTDVAEGDDIRHTFTGWTSDSPGGYTGSDNPATVVMNNDIVETALWETEYRLTMESDAGGTVRPSSDWHYKGEPVEIVATPNSGYEFVGWEGIGSGSYSGTNDGTVIMMHGPITQRAVFKKEPATVIIETEHGTVDGEGTYEVGSTATLSVSPIVDVGSGIRQVFERWDITGGRDISENPASIVVEEDLTISAQWERQYLLTVESPIEVEGGGWCEEGDLVTLRVDSPQGFLVRQVFRGWSGDVVSSSPSVTFVMDGPKTVVVEWVADYTQALMVGGVASVVVASAGYVSVQRSRREKRRQARTNLKNMLIEELKNADDIVRLDELAITHGISGDEVKGLIDEALPEGKIKGNYSNDGTAFVSNKVLMKILKDKLY